MARETAAGEAGEGRLASMAAAAKRGCAVCGARDVRSLTVVAVPTGGHAGICPTCRRAHGVKQARVLAAQRAVGL